MKECTEKSIELYEVLLSRGYQKELCELITLNLNTDWTAQRMLGYLAYNKDLPVQEIVDEMLAILSDRTQIINKHELEESNARWNEYLESRRNRAD